ncbi:hypothetical protein PL11_005050 [Lentilactobacillus curieae]|uniref:Uncharacterized protein n=1 Tax=Lentilactobacillus curieae TaxID=1138822 RepID=A0A1S6QIA7_9LACO|nr:hypothetical protein [Lentilactobacillus curieae]AQW21340.1 hypothetical protein PL11_005050 [Lentilactobacillus curieae]
MDDEQKWLLDQLDQLQSETTSFIEKSLFDTTKRIIVQQGKRIEQHEGELDGRIWNPGKW